MITPRDRIDSELARALDAVPKGPAGIYDLSDIDGTREAVRRQAKAMVGDMLDDPSISVDVLHAARPDGSLLALRCFTPGQDKPLPALLWFQGGGQILGFAVPEDPFLKRISSQTGCIVASVDYRLAPEHRAPAAAGDGALAYDWLRGEAAPLGIDRERIGIAGASGGGGIAAATALILRDRNAAPPLFLSLSYPMLDDRNATHSAHEITDIGVWDRSANLLAWQAILGDSAGTDAVSQHQAAARADDLSGLPPAFVAVGDLDVFRDEALDFARRLVADGVAVELHLFPGAFHAWGLFAPEAAMTETFNRVWQDFLLRRFGETAR